MELILITSLIVLIYVYFLYPVLLRFFSLFTEQKLRSLVAEESKILIIVPAHNEDKVIQEKLDNHLKINYKNYHIVVLADTCTDKTEEIVNSYTIKEPGKISLYSVDDGLGKTNAINKLMANLEEKYDILVFSDANVYLAEDSLSEINNQFNSNEKLGCIAGQLTYINEDSSGAAQSNGLYWRYEEFIKKYESSSGSMMGADGSIFAVKATLYRQLPVHVLDDFSTSIGAICQGFELKISEKIKAYEKGAESTGEEFARKVRISNRSYNSFKHLKPEILKTFSGVNIIKLYSHKVLRWYSFLFMLLAYVTNLALFFTADNSFYDFLFLSQSVFYTLGFLSFKNIPLYKLNKIGSVAEYFTMANLAAGIGVFQSIKGVQTIVWKKADSTR